MIHNKNIFSQQNTFPNGSIQFHEIEESDVGKYRCHAENKHGEDEEMLHLYVKGKMVGEDKIDRY